MLDATRPLPDRPQQGARRIAAAVLAAARLAVLAAALAPVPLAGAAPPGPAEATPAPRPRVVLALSGGGARGFAHIGVLRGLERCGIPIDAIAGTSMGAIVGGLYALGYSPEELEGLALGSNVKGLLLQGRRGVLPIARELREDWSLLTVELDQGGIRLPAGIVASQGLAERLSLLLIRASGSTGFEGLQIPFRAIAADLETGQKVALDSGSLAIALRASSAVPGVFEPVVADGRLLIDGGVRDNLPVDDARALGGELVIAVDITSPLRGRGDLSSFLAVIDQAIGFSMVERTRVARGLADVLIEPEIGSLGTFDFARDAALDSITCGEEAAAAACSELRARIGGERTPDRSSAEPAPHVYAVEVLRLDVAGARPAMANLVRRFFGPLPEDGYLPLTELERRLMRVRALAELDRLDLDYSAASSGLTLEVDEAPEVALRVAARFDDKVGVLGRIAATWRPTLGPFRGIGADITFGTVTDVGLEARIDRLLGTPFLAYSRALWREDFDLVARSAADPGELEQRRRGFEAGLGVAFGLSGLATLRCRWLDQESDPSPELDPALAEEFKLGSVAAEILFDGSDRGAYPTRGVAFRVSGELADPALGGEVDFARIAGDLEAWLPLGNRVVAWAHGRAGEELSGDLPEMERWVAGGNDTFPGLAHDELRGDTLLAGAVGLRVRLASLPPALGRAVYLGVEGAVGSLRGGDPTYTDGGRAPLGVALRGAIDSRLGPIDLELGFDRDGDSALTIDVGPRF